MNQESRQKRGWQKAVIAQHIQSKAKIRKKVMKFCIQKINKWKSKRINIKGSASGSNIVEKIFFLYF